MSIVVTGASGFIGGTLVPTLSAQCHVVAIDRRPPPMRMAEVTHLTGELTQPSDDILDALHGADAVVHLAGCPGVRDAAPDVEFRRHRDNVAATQMVLAATRPHTPVMVMSSSSVYGGARSLRRNGITGEAPRLRPSREDDPLMPRGGYAASKIAVEKVCRQRADAGHAVLVMRPFTVLGEGQRGDMALARWAAEAWHTGAVTVLGSAARTRDFTDVRMVARALTMLLFRGVTGTVNLGTGQGHSLAELAQAAGAAVGVPEPRLHVVGAGDAEVRHTLADTERLRSLIGPVPLTDVHDVARRAIASLPQLSSAPGAGWHGALNERPGAAAAPVENSHR